MVGCCYISLYEFHLYIHKVTSLLHSCAAVYQRTAPIENYEPGTNQKFQNTHTAQLRIAQKALKSHCTIVLVLSTIDLNRECCIKRHFCLIDKKDLAASLFASVFFHISMLVMKIQVIHQTDLFRAQMMTKRGIEQFAQVFFPHFIHLLPWEKQKSI